MDIDEDEEHVASAVGLETLEFLQPADHHDHNKKRRASSSRSGGGGGKRGGGGGVAPAPAPASCQAERCYADLTEEKKYHHRHKVCQFHAKAPVALVAGLRQRFCQQCSRFHELSEFDEAKRSCRRRLAGHNQRRRKSSSGEPNGESPPSTSSGSTPLTLSHHKMKEETMQVYYH